MSDNTRFLQRLLNPLSRYPNRLKDSIPFLQKKIRAVDRSKDSYVRYAFEECKIWWLVGDLKAFYRKMTYFMPRVTGNFVQYRKSPPGLQIEPTNYCNVSCICCPASRSSRKKGYMDIDLFQRIIDEASQVGVKMISLLLHGEPLLHPKIVDMIRYVKSKDLALSLTTNGTLFGGEEIEAILHSGLDSGDNISFSIFGNSEEVHEQIMRQGDFKKEVKSILKMLELRKKLKAKGPIIETLFHTMPENKHEENDYLKNWRKVVDHARLGGKVSVSFSEYKRKCTTVAPRTQTCGRIWEVLPVFWNGDATICAHDVDGEYVIGNLKEHSIGQLWNSEKLLALRKIHKLRRFEDFSLCRNCDL